MDIVWERISKHTAGNSASKEKVCNFKSELVKHILEKSEMQQQAEDRLKSAKQEYERKLVKDKKAAQTMKALETELQLLRRATNLKFTGPNSGVLLHKGKPKQFVVPSKGNKFQTVNDLWDILEQSHAD